MPILLYTIGWMTYNIFLAFIPVILALIIIRCSNTVLKKLLFIPWLLFLPNSIYLLSDYIHMKPNLARTDGLESLLLIKMFIILFGLGIFTYIISIYPLENTFKRFKNQSIAILVVLNILISLGLILGRVYRFNSWDMLTHPHEIFLTTLNIVRSPMYITFIVLFSMSATLLYIFLTRRYKKQLRKLLAL